MRSNVIYTQSTPQAPPTSPARAPQPPPPPHLPSLAPLGTASHNGPADLRAANARRIPPPLSKPTPSRSPTARPRARRPPRCSGISGNRGGSGVPVGRPCAVTWGTGQGCKTLWRVGGGWRGWWLYVDYIGTPRSLASTAVDPMVTEQLRPWLPSPPGGRRHPCGRTGPRLARRIAPAADQRRFHRFSPVAPAASQGAARGLPAGRGCGRSCSRVASAWARSEYASS